jgi:hypothetical protein
VWEVHPERDYEFQFKENLADANWTTATNFTTQSDESSVTIINDAGTNRHRFYRLLDVTLP